jgi:transposase-like protein
MSGKQQKYSPEFREEAARMVVEGSRAIAQVAREYGLSETTLGNWVRAYRETHASDELPLELSERLLRVAQPATQPHRATPAAAQDQNPGVVRSL